MRARLPRAARRASESSSSSEGPCESSAAALLREHGAVPSRILPWLYLSGAGCASDAAAVRRLGIGLIVNCAGEIVDNAFEAVPLSDAPVSYVTLSLRDGPFEDIASLFPTVCAAIESARCAGIATLLHCHQGVSRSASFAIAYVMWAGGVPLTFAYPVARARRPIISPNAGFSCQLVEWGDFISACSIVAGGGIAQGAELPSAADVLRPEQAPRTEALASVRESAREEAESAAPSTGSDSPPGNTHAVRVFIPPPLLFSLRPAPDGCYMSGQLFGLPLGSRRPLERVLVLVRDDADRALIFPTSEAIMSTITPETPALIVEWERREADAEHSDPHVAARCSLCHASDAAASAMFAAAARDALTTLSSICKPAPARARDVCIDMLRDGGWAVITKVAARRGGVTTAPPRALDLPPTGLAEQDAVADAVFAFMRVTPSPPLHLQWTLNENDIIPATETTPLSGACARLQAAAALTRRIPSVRTAVDAPVGARSRFRMEDTSGPSLNTGLVPFLSLLPLRGATFVSRDAAPHRRVTRSSSPGSGTATPFSSYTVPSADHSRPSSSLGDSSEHS